MIMRFREFQESEAHNDRFRAKPYAQQRCSGVGIMLDSHLGGLHVLVVEVIEIVEVDHLCQILPFQQSRWRSACACIPPQNMVAFQFADDRQTHKAQNRGRNPELRFQVLGSSVHALWWLIFKRGHRSAQEQIATR